MTVLLSDFRRTHDLSMLCQVDHSAIEIVTFNDFWDGPLNGLVRFNEQLHWYETYFDEALDDCPVPRPFVIVEIDLTILDDELYWHHLFRDHVVNRDVTPAIYHPQHQHQAFYGPYSQRTPFDLSQSPIIGWVYLL